MVRLLIILALALHPVLAIPTFGCGDETSAPGVSCGCCCGPLCAASDAGCGCMTDGQDEPREPAVPTTTASKLLPAPPSGAAVTIVTPLAHPATPRWSATGLRLPSHHERQALLCVWRT